MAAKTFSLEVPGLKFHHHHELIRYPLVLKCSLFVKKKRIYDDTALLYMNTGRSAKIMDAQHLNVQKNLVLFV